MPFVLDASVTFAWLFRDETSEHAQAVLARLDHDEGIVPSLWSLEVGNGLIVAERRGRVTSAEIPQVVQLCLELPLSVRDLSRASALGTVLSLARDQNLSIYDATYLRLAMQEGISLATHDRRLAAAATRVGVPLVS